MFRAGSEGHNRSSAACQWGSIALAHGDAAAAGQTLIGRELIAPRFTHPIKPPAPLLSRLLSLHEAAGHLAKTAPEILAHSEVAPRTSDRTLRICCQEHLGMSPMRYLWLRRMHLARRALRMADPAAATVTDIATNYGFWEFGRFSVAFRSLFGETPSASLLRPPDDPRPQKTTGSPWQLPESA
jgi:AraC-like DNA-binding protein